MTDNVHIPKKLTGLVDYIKDRGVQLTRQNEDGRVNSANDEAHVIRILREGIREVHEATARAWYDFKLDDYYINLKITAGQVDNLNCKLGMYYSLTGCLPKFNNSIGWEKYIEILQKDIKPNDVDYYFLTLFKAPNLSKEAYILPLKAINNLVPNGSNLPFQADTGNHELVNRSYEDAKKYILTKFKESLQIRASGFNAFRTHFPDI